MSTTKAPKRRPIGLGLTSFALLSAALCFVGCKKKTPPAPPPAASAPAPELQKNEVQNKAPVVPVAPTGHKIPIGPQLIVQPGKGVSAILFGATRQTIERHMGAPCDIVSETRCTYVKQAIDFTLEDGVLSKIAIHRRDRPVPGGGDQLFGTFRGVLPPRIVLNLHRHIVVEEFGKPTREEEVALSGPVGLVARHHYDGLELEYERIENGNTVLAGMVVTPSKTAKPVLLPAPPK